MLWERGRSTSLPDRLDSGPKRTFHAHLVSNTGEAAIRLDQASGVQVYFLLPVAS